MYAAVSSRTMQSARPKFRVPDPDERVVVLYPREPEKRRPEQILMEQEAAEAERIRREEEAARIVDAAVAKYKLCVFQTQTDKPRAIDVAKAAALPTGVPFKLITGKSRNKAVVAARNICIRAVADARPDMSLPQIGRLFNKDHTTIIHSLKKTKQPGAVR